MTTRSRSASLQSRCCTIVIHAHDLPGLARFWAEVLDWRFLSEREREVVIGPEGICFMLVTDRKVVENRLHLDLTSAAADREVEIERILALGARRADVGQTGNESWTVLVDPNVSNHAVPSWECSAARWRRW